MSFLKSLFSKLTGGRSQKAPSAPARMEPFITISDDEIICSYPSKNRADKVNWKNISKIEVLTTDEGPWFCDLFILISDDMGGVVIPEEKEECQQIIDKMLALPGFDFDAFTAAIRSTDNMRFLVWQKSNEDAR